MEELSGNYLVYLSLQLSSVHHESNIDGYGDEGAGYDFDKQVLQLVEEGWIPPSKQKLAEIWGVQEALFDV